MAELNLGTQYSVNQSLDFGFNELTKEEKTKKFLDFELLNFLHTNKYYMLLCHEKRDYTLFHVTGNYPFTFAGTELQETIENRGEVVSIEKAKHGGYELWVKDRETANCYLLFPYDYGIVEV